MKKLDVRFDTEKVDGLLGDLSCTSDFYCKSEIARAAMNIGLKELSNAAQLYNGSLDRAIKAYSNQASSNK